MSGGKYTDDVQGYNSSMDTRNLKWWHRIKKNERALLNDSENVEKSLRRLDVPLP